MLVVINTAFTISLVLLANAEPEAQFGGRLGFPSIGGPLKLRLMSLYIPLVRGSTFQDQVLHLLITSV